MAEHPPQNVPRFDPADAARRVAEAGRRRRRTRALLLAALVAGGVSGAILLGLRVAGWRALERERAAYAMTTVRPEAVEFGDPSARHRILLVHGLGGSPADFRDWPERLAERTGAWVGAMLLPGHGEGPDAFAGCDESDWREALARRVRELSSDGASVDVIGFSLGASLALDVSVEHPPRRLVLIAPYFRDAADGPLPGFVAAATRVFAPFVPWVDAGPTSRGLSPQAVGRPPRQRAWPLATVVAAQRVAARARSAERLALVTSPALVLHARADRITAWRAARRAAEALPAGRWVELSSGDHVVPWDSARDEAFEAIVAFLATE